MPTKRKTKKVSNVKKSKKIDISVSKNSLEFKLVENLIALQKIHVKLTDKFDKLTDHITDLLVIFESAAKSIAEHPSENDKNSERDKDFLEKIDKLLDQNKVIAKGLTLMEQRVREKMFGPVPAHQGRLIRMAPRFEKQKIEKPKKITSEYQPTQKIEWEANNI